MKESERNLTQHIAARVRELRAARRLSLDALAAKSHVSRSMLSLIERGESSPTAVVLLKLATGLGITLASLFDPPAITSAGPLARREEQSEWRDPASGYIRRNVSPLATPRPVQIVEVRFPPRRRVAFENGGIGHSLYQQVWMLKGEMEITVGNERHRLQQGDCLAMQLDRPTMFHNPTRYTARYAVVIAAETSRHR